MATPSMMWHHDGEACLASMVRWCDHETSAPTPCPSCSPRGLYWAYRAPRRMRMGPFAVDGSTARPPCAISTVP